MRHLNAINQLGRDSSERKAMIANMASSLILHKRIETTTAKARVLRSYVEPLINRSKEDSTHSRRVVFRYLGDKNAVAELFREVAPRVADRPGGYTRILKTGFRLGDGAEMCIIELVDFNENMLADQAGKAKATRRRRGTRKKSTETAAVKESTSVKASAAETASAETEQETAAGTTATAETAAGSVAPEEGGSAEPEQKQESGSESEESQ